MPGTGLYMIAYLSPQHPMKGELLFLSASVPGERTQMQISEPKAKMRM